MTKTFISAGAGSGKTYRITTDVAKMVFDGKLNPEQVIMTTFTKAAAQELREKAKKELAKLGKHREAQQMEHALIGTVHSVANSFLTKYWYLLGIMPDAAAMEENELQLYRDHSLRGLLEPKDRNFLYRYAEDYNVIYDPKERKSGINYEFWKADLCKVLDFMQWYGINEEQLKKSLETTESFIKCLEPKEDTSLMECAKAVICEVEEILTSMTRPGAKAKAEFERINYYKGRELSIDEQNDLESIAKGRCKDSDNTKRLSASLSGMEIFTEERSKRQREYASLIFRLASRWQKEYRQYKDEHHLIDFNDMEEMFLDLLGMPEVQNDIKSRYTHLFVDEFQDSNPMQVRIFQGLSKLLNTCYVGDKKQAIYGFRGSDTELTAAVADSISDTEHLEHSYRSVKPLVDFSNAIFSQVFSKMTEKEVKLSMPEKNGNDTPVKHPLRLWPYNGDKNLAQQIQQFILQEGMDAKDVAVLARTNENLDKLADELRALKVPVCRESNDIKESRAGRLMKALLTLVNRPHNQLARAEVAYLTEPGYNVTKIIENRLDFLSEESQDPTVYLKEVPILNRLGSLLSFRSTKEQEFATNLLGYQSISSLVESLVIELDLYALVQGWENALAEETNLQVLIDLARRYEDYATKLAQPATVAGFIDFFTGQKQDGAANEDGVRLFTYHKSKGLEWKVVILLSLENDAADATKIATRSMLGCHYHREQLPTPENPNPPMTISLVRNIYAPSNENAKKSAVTSRMQLHPSWQSISEREIGENARLLYVGVTRAREILILAPKEKDNGITLSWFRSVGVKNVAQLLDGSHSQDLFGIGMPFHIERYYSDNVLAWPEHVMNGVHDMAKDFSPLNNILFVSPSKAETAPHDIVPINDKEHRMLVRNKTSEEALMGDFIHQVFCCCDDGISVERIIQLRDSYGFTEKNMPEPGRLLDSWIYLTDLLESRYGKSVMRHHEKPFRHIDDEGHVVSGYIDLIWETVDSYIIIDYKTCPGSYSLVFNPTSEHYAGRHGDQLDCYQQALEAEGKKKVAARIIYYPVTQFVVEVK